MPLPAGVQSFSDLVKWLIREHHDGSPYRMARALSVSAGLPFQWRDGTVKAPSPPTLARLCEVYRLDWDDVMRLLYPRPPRGRRRLTPIGGGSANEGTLPLLAPDEVLRLIGIWLRRLFGPWSVPALA